MSDSIPQSNKRKRLPTLSPSPQPEAPKRSRQEHNETTTATLSAAMANHHLHQPKVAAPVGAAIFDEPVSYLDLKAWIAEQEALPQPEPLTDIQKRAILDLKNSIKKTKHSFNLEDADWVSLLMSKVVPSIHCKLLRINPCHRI